MNCDSILQNLMPRLFLSPNELDANKADETKDGVPFNVEVNQVSENEIRIQITWKNYIERLLGSFSEDRSLFAKDYKRQVTIIAGERVSELPLSDVIRRVARVAGYKDDLIERILEVCNQRLGIDIFRYIHQECFGPLNPTEKSPIYLYNFYGVRISQELSGKLYDIGREEISEWSYWCRVELNVETGDTTHTISLFNP